MKDYKADVDINVRSKMHVEAYSLDDAEDRIYEMVEDKYAEYPDIRVEKVEILELYKD